MGAVEQAIRARFTGRTSLRTFGHAVPFVLSTIDHDGIVLLLGDGDHPARLPWDCLESVVPFLRSRSGWVRAGGNHSVKGEPGTLDEHLKGCGPKKDTARWLARVLSDAEIVETSERPALHVRLSQRYRQ